ncbi:bifunctional folylpolyglutamate synthase/dihydrofolate synthase [Ligilactobacillus equi]|nr:folylpolyglutamate synthase/dihydrofolate synthase family protein [Ligilactobacillus equi]
MFVRDYQAALDFIHGRTKFKKKPTLTTMKLLMERLGNPQEQLKVIHVTGTNGKGSTTAFIRELLLAHGFEVGTFTSPFIVKFNERIALNGQMINDETLVTLVNQVGPVVAELDAELGEQGPTEFEIITALMFTYFGQIKPDYVVVEVGLGGLLDSTNIIQQPLVSVITTVGYDHAQILGSTLPEIAQQKAGIIKASCPLVLGKVSPEVAQVIKAVAREKKAPYYQLGQAFKNQATGLKDGQESFIYSDDSFHKLALASGLLGAYQVDNATCALKAVSLVAQAENFQLQTKLVKLALAQTAWPARMEKIFTQPLVFLDGAHNLAAFEELATMIKSHFNANHVFLILGILADKEPEKMLTMMAKLPNVQLILTDFDAYRQVADPQKLATKLPQAQAISPWKIAFKTVVTELLADESDVIIFAGSLYFVSEVRAFFKEEMDE